MQGRTSGFKREIGIRVWDTPGLKDGTREDKKYLNEILCVWDRYKHKDLVIFCIEARTRYVPGRDNLNVQAMIDLTKKFGEDFWKNAIIVLTFANTIETFNLHWRGLSSEEKARCFRTKVEEYANAIKSSMTSCGISRSIIERIKVVPAGYHTIPELPDRKYWFTPLWFACLQTISTKEARAVIALHNQDRLQIRSRTELETRRVNTSNLIIDLTDNFLPHDLLDLQRKYKKCGGLIGLIGLLGGPVVLVTIALGMWGGRRYGESRYATQIQDERDS